uniref:DUF637 domain-containing protein n=1 Tax=Bartonella sp. TT29SHDZB TaxID=3243581 RepID=UPI0035D032EB
NGDFTSGGALNAISEQDFNSFDLDLRGKEGDKSKQKNKFRQQSTEVTTNKTTIEAEGNLSMHAQNGHLTLGAAGLSSGGQTHLAADKGKIKFLTNKDQDFKDVYQRNENLVWWSESDKGYLKETIEHVTIDAKGGMKLDAGNGFVVEYEATGDLDKSLEQLSLSPGMAWIKQLRDDPELSKQVDWQAVKAEFKDWDYKAQGLTEAGAAIVALAVTAVTGGAASGAASAITGALGLGSSTAMNAAIQAGVQALINKSAVALVNNRGNIAGALHELGSSKNVLSIVSSMLTAGLTSQLTEMAGVGQSLPKTAPFVDRIALEAEKNLIKAAIGTGVQTALEGGSLDKNFFNNLRIALSDTVGKSLAEEIGTAKAEGKINTVTQIVAHAGLGCLKGAVASGACSAGAIGGAVGEATAMLQFKLSTKNFIQKEIAALDGRVPTAEEQARINAKIEAQFSDFNDHAIDIARIAGGFAAALAGGDVNTGADAAGNAAENNFLPAVAAAVAFIVSLTPQELAALSLFMAGGATIVQSPNNRTAIADFLTYWFASKNSAEDSEKTNQNSQEEKNKDSQKESKNKKKNGNNKEPQNNNDDDNDGKGKKLNKGRKYHDKKRDEEKQRLEEEGFSPSEGELTIEIEIKTDKGTIKARTRPDNTYIEDGEPAFSETKTGKAKLNKMQKALREICKTTGSIKFCGPKAEEYLKKNKEKFNKYQENLEKFIKKEKPTEEQLKKFNKEWPKKQLSKKWEKGPRKYKLNEYPSYLEEK